MTMAVAAKPVAPEESVSYRNLYISALIINIVYFGAGASMVWTSPALPRLRDPHSQFAGQLNEGFFISCYVIGQIIGPLLGGCVMDFLGRKPSAAIMVIFLLVSYSMLAIAPTVHFLYIARVIGGFTFGMSVSVLPVYVAELSDAQMRSTLNSLPLASRSLGYFSMYAVGPLLGYLDLLLVSLVAPVAAALLLPLVPESPCQLVAMGNTERAHGALQWLRRGASKQQVQAELDSIQKSVEEMKMKKKGLRDLFSSRANIRALYISCGLLFFLQLSGVPVILSITESLFHLANVTLSPQISTLVFGALMLAVGLMGPAVTRRCGYKGPLFVSALGMALSLVVFGAHFYMISQGYDMSTYSLVPLGSLVCYISFYSLGFSNSAFAVVGELFAPNVKAIGTSLTNSIGFGFALVSIQLFYAIKVFGIHFGIWSFACINAVAVPFVFFYVPDTSGKSLDEIQEMLSKPWFDKKNKVLPVEEKYTMKEVV